MADRGARVSSAARVGYLGLGSNVGDRRANLQAALDGLAGRGVSRCSTARRPTTPTRSGRSSISPTFLNAALRGQHRARTAGAPRHLQGARARPRPRSPTACRHGPRLIDIDVLLLGELEHSSERLRLPHEQVLARRFVLIPLLELDFELVTPAGERLVGRARGSRCR